MCGIGGVMMYPKNRTSEQLTFIKELVTNLALENQARGSDATGVAVMNKNGYDVLKHNVPADEFTMTGTYLEFLDRNIGNNTYNILVHTRHATQGSPNNNANNHPIMTSTAIGVHNGWVSNDDKLFASEGLYRLAQVDSEIIFRLSDKEIGNEKENTKNIAEKLSGIYAVAFCKKDEPQKLNYFRSNNPTTFAYIPELNITIFASVKKYVTDAIALANATVYYELGFSVDEEQVFYFEPKTYTVMQFDVTENTPLQQLRQEVLSFQDKDEFGYGYYGKGAWFDDDWYYDQWKEERGEEKEKEITNIYEFIEEKGLQYLMSDEDYTQMIELLNQNEQNQWSEGYVAGRESTDNDVKLLKEQIKKQAKLAN